MTHTDRSEPASASRARIARSPSLRNWLPEERLSRFLSDAIDAMDLSAFDARYRDSSPGNQAFDPRMMPKVLIYAYTTGTFSSRKIAAKFHNDVVFRVLGAGNFPAHRTLSDFRQRYLSEFREIFVQVVQPAREVRLVKLGTVAVDGSKLRSNARTKGSGGDLAPKVHSAQDTLGTRREIAAPCRIAAANTRCRRGAWSLEPFELRRRRAVRGIRAAAVRSGGRGDPRLRRRARLRAATSPDARRRHAARSARRSRG